MEVFGLQQYEPPYDCGLNSNSAQNIVDLGGYCGYSAIFFLSRFPHSKVTVLEPHPAHVRTLKKNLHLNRYEARACVIAAAAGVADTDSVLSDDNCTSTVGGHSGFPIAVKDVFTHLPAGTIDLLKIDIEGSEIEVMSDPRFEQLAQRTSVLTLEWHHTEDKPDGRAWCMERLKQVGFDTIVDGTVQYRMAGIIWAYRTKSEPSTRLQSGA